MHLPWQEVILTILYSIAGLGIAIVNDFKSIEGVSQLHIEHQALLTCMMCLHKRPFTQAALVNDCEPLSLTGDRALGMNSLPVAFGVDTAKWICVASIDATQVRRFPHEALLSPASL